MIVFSFNHKSSISRAALRPSLPSHVRKCVLMTLGKGARNPHRYQAINYRDGTVLVEHLTRATNFQRKIEKERFAVAKSDLEEQSSARPQLQRQGD